MVNTLCPKILDKTYVLFNHELYYFKRGVNSGSWRKTFVRQANDHILFLSPTLEYSEIQYLQHINILLWFYLRRFSVTSMRFTFYFRGTLLSFATLFIPFRRAFRWSWARKVDAGLEPAQFPGTSVSLDDDVACLTANSDPEMFSDDKNPWLPHPSTRSLPFKTHEDVYWSYQVRIYPLTQSQISTLSLAPLFIQKRILFTWTTTRQM